MMKNFAKIFTAIVVAFAAYSCVADATEDLGVNINVVGQNSLTLSLDETRVQLGEKAEGVYPLYWSNGDQIAVNGVASVALTDVAEGAKSATFQFDGNGVSAPFNIVYPAPEVAVAAEEGEEEAPAAAAYPVVFPAVQQYVAGNIDPKAMVLYGYAANGEVVTLNPLVGVLQLNVTGNGEKVTKLTVKSEKGKIAGSYTVDCTNGTLTEVEASNTVTMNLDVTLGAEAQVLYVAVPAGSYGTFVVTLQTAEHGKMTVKFNSDVKPIEAGTVREFKPFPFAANNADEEGVFEIDSEEALIEFARIAKAFYPHTKAVVTAPITVTEDWTPIEGFGAYEFDGGEFEISGLNAPLFGSTAANIHHVKLTNVNMEVTTLAKSGALVCELYGGSLENCSATGAININNTTTNDSAIGNDYNGLCYGGLVGYASAATVTNCTNDIDITITSLQASTLAKKATVGGVVGGCADSSSLSYLTNNGTIEYVGTTQNNNMYISGVLGKTSDASATPIIKLSNCTNNGNISCAKGSKASSKDVLLSGITGTLSLPDDEVCENCVNTGDMTFNGECKSPRCSGLTSYTTSASFYNCTNSGDMTLGENAVATGDVFLTGLCGSTVTSPSVSKCSNSGKLTVKTGASTSASTSVYMTGLFAGISNTDFSDNHNSGDLVIENDITFQKLIYLAGVANSVAGADSKVTGCTNSGAFSVGSFTNATTGNNGRLYIGGLFRTVTGGTISNCKNLAGGTITASPKLLSTETMIAGIVAYASAGVSTTFTDCANEAAITLTGDYVNGIYLGGVMGQVYSKTTDYVLSFTRTHNSGDITVGGKSISYVVADDGTVSAGQIVGIGGLLGYTLGTEINLTDCDNSGDVTVNPTENCHTLNVGGIVGWHQHRLDNYITTFTNCDNTGKITYAPAKVAGLSRVGGFHGYAYGHTSYSKGQDIYNTCTNTAEVEVSGTGTLTGNLFVGSFVGYMDQSSKMTGCSATSTSKVTVSIKKVSGKTGLGWIGSCSSLESGTAYDFTSCTNSSTVTISSTGLAALELAGFVGGNYINAQPKAQTVNATDCKVEGSINITGKCGGDVRYGGFNAYPYASGNKHTLTRFINDCDFNVTGELTKSLQVGGVAAYLSAGMTTIEKCVVSGDFNFSGKTATYVSYGGYAQNINLTPTESNAVNNFIHTGNVTITGTVGTNLLIGGFSAQQKSAYYTNNIYNSGNITLGTAEKALTVGGTYAYVGGLFSDLDGTYDGNAITYSLNGDKIYVGDITVQNTTFSNAECEVKVGGIIGKLTASGIIDNAKFYGNIKAIGMEGKVGAIAGSNRESGVVTNSSVGGNLIFAETTTEEDDPNGGEPITTVSPVLTPLTASNWFKYIYSAAVTEDVATGDGCELLLAKPATPVYTPAAN